MARVRFRLFTPRKSLCPMRQADPETRLGREQSGPHVVPLVLPRLRLSLRSDRDLRGGRSGRARGLKPLNDPQAAERSLRWRTGNRIRTISPCGCRSCSDSAPPCASAMALVIERPRPKPAASSMLRASSPRTNGSSMFCFSASEMPGPSSSTSMVSSIRRDAKADHRFGAEPHGILHQIGDGAVQIVRPHRRHGMRGAVIGDLASDVGELVGDRAAACWRRRPASSASSLRPLRRNDSTESSIARIWSRSPSMRLRWVSSSMNSERSRIRVIGVRRSWLIAASILVRSSIRPVMRSRMRLSARATERISSGPRSGSGAAAPFRLKLSAALAKDDSGAVSARAAHRPEQRDADDGEQQRHHPGPAQKRRPRPVRQDVGRNHRAVGQADAELAGARRRSRAGRRDSHGRGGAAGRAG